MKGVRILVYVREGLMTDRKVTVDEDTGLSTRRYTLTDHAYVVENRQ